MIKYITQRPLWFNILVAIGIVVILFLIFMFSLRLITRHGEAISVPNVMGKNINEVSELLSEGGFETVIQDSVFHDSLPPGIVVKQLPEADQVVKVNRTIYVVINRFVPPDINMPNLIGFSLRNAELTLNNLGLKLGDTTSKPDFAKGSVIEQLYNGNPVRAGEKIRIGSEIDLVIAAGLGEEDIKVPDLVGLTFAEAKIVLEASGLILGVPITDQDVRDQESAYVYWQSPPPKKEDGVQLRIRPGQMIDIRLGVNPPVRDTTGNQAPQPLQFPQ